MSISNQPSRAGYSQYMTAEPFGQKLASCDACFTLHRAAIQFSETDATALLPLCFAFVSVSEVGFLLRVRRAVNYFLNLFLCRFSPSCVLPSCPAASAAF